MDCRPSLNHSGDSGHFTHAHPSEDAASSQASMPSHACRTYPRSCWFKRENSQRTGRKDPEEKKSGVTNNQPASRAREPDKQPAKGPQEPLPESSLASLPSPAQVPVGGSPDAAEPSSAKVYPKKKLTMLKCGILPQVQFKHLPQSWRLQSNNRHHASKWRPNCFAHLKCVSIIWFVGSRVAGLRCWQPFWGPKPNLRQPFRRFSANMVPLQILFRTALVLRSLSASALAGAFKAARPWQQLKQMAANHSPTIRLVLENELQEPSVPLQSTEDQSKPRHLPKGDSRVLPFTCTHRTLAFPWQFWGTHRSVHAKQIAVGTRGSSLHWVGGPTIPQAARLFTAQGSGLGFLVLSPACWRHTPLKSHPQVRPTGSQSKAR